MAVLSFSSAFSRISGHLSAQAGRSLAKTDSTFQQEGANLIDHAGSSGHQPVAYPMQSLQIKLIFRLDGYETHVLPFHGFGNRFRIAVVILVGLHERSHKLRGNQAHLVSWFAQRSPRKCDPTPASLPIKHAGKFAVYISSCERENFLPITTWERIPSAMRWKVVLPRSIPIDLICMVILRLAFCQPPSSLVGWLDGGPSHYRHYTHLRLRRDNRLITSEGHNYL